MVQMRLKIEGMACGMCEAHINDEIRRNFPEVTKVTSSHKKGETIILAKEAIEEEKLKKVIADTGYECKEVETSPYEKKKGFLWMKK